MTDTDYEKTAVSSVDLNTTQAVATPVAERTALSANVECPVCRTPNPPSERYCIDCGFLLSQEPVEVEAVPEVPSAAMLVTSDGVREFSLQKGENTVGRENADVLLAHNSVSRRHAKITVAEGRVLVEDLGSTNGTYVDGTKVEPGSPAEVQDGAELRFGNDVLTLKLPEPAQEPEAVVEGEASAESPAEDEVPAESEASAEVESGEEMSVEGEAEPSSVGISESQSEPAAPIARLVSSDRAMTFDLAPAEYKIGRRQGENDIVVPDPYTSGRHADLTVAEGSITITDVGSSNGTCVNGSKLDPNAPCEVKPGDRITIGQFELTLEAM